MHRRADRRAVLAGAETLVPASENGFRQKEAPLVEENGLLGRLREPDSRAALSKKGVFTLEDFLGGKTQCV